MQGRADDDIDGVGHTHACGRSGMVAGTVVAVMATARGRARQEGRRTFRLPHGRGRLVVDIVAVDVAAAFVERELIDGEGISGGTDQRDIIAGVIIVTGAGKPCVTGAATVGDVVATLAAGG